MAEYESSESFMHRKNRAITALISKTHRWSNVWAQRVIAWNDHVNRNTSGSCWSAKLVTTRSPEELEYRRCRNHQRPDVRCISGFSAVRWYESLSVARSV